MVTNNLAARKGRCINFGNCNIADTKEIIELNLGDDFVCSNPECRGMLVEVKKQSPKKWIFYLGIAVLLIGTILIFIVKSKIDQATEMGKVVDKAITTIESIGHAQIETKKDDSETTQTQPSGSKTLPIETTKAPTAGGGTMIEEGERVSKEPIKYSNRSKNFENGDRYVGEMKNGEMHGLGTLYYNSDQIISEKDLKKRKALKGDYLIGEWYEGRVVNGKLFDSNNSQKEVIIIGR